MTARSWLSDLVDVALPAGCVACRGWIPGGRTLVCARCRSRLRDASWPRCPRCHHPRGTGRVAEPDCLHCRTWPPALTRARFACVLDGPAADLVHALKYEGWREVADFMAERMTSALDEAEVGGSVVVPVPTTARRVRSRGYNQADLLARGVAARLGTPRVDALHRPHGRVSQTTLAPAARRGNVRGAFAASNRRPPLHGRRVVLVDDVLTTGATLAEAAAVLVAEGAVDVTALTFARALPDAASRAA